MDKETFEAMKLNEIESNIVMGQTEDLCFKCGRSLKNKEMCVLLTGFDASKTQCYSLKREAFKICDIITNLNSLIKKHKLTLSRSTYKKIIKAIEDIL